MLAEYLPNGQIWHLIFDPLPEGTVEKFTELGKTFLVFEGDRSVSSATLYVKDGAVAPRPTFDVETTYEVTSGSNPLVIPVPVGTVVTYMGQQETITDGTLEIETSSPGEYDLVLELFPYIPKGVKVIVHET